VSLMRVFPAVVLLLVVCTALSVGALALTYAGSACSTCDFGLFYQRIGSLACSLFFGMFAVALLVIVSLIRLRVTNVRYAPFPLWVTILGAILLILLFLSLRDTSLQDASARTSTSVDGSYLRSLYISRFLLGGSSIAYLSMLHISWSALDTLRHRVRTDTDSQ
jgi:hypothetical protein